MKLQCNGTLWILWILKEYFILLFFLHSAFSWEEYFCSKILLETFIHINILNNIQRLPFIVYVKSFSVFAVFFFIQLCAIFLYYHTKLQNVFLCENLKIIRLEASTDGRDAETTSKPEFAHQQVLSLSPAGSWEGTFQQCRTCVQVITLSLQAW